MVEKLRVLLVGKVFILKFCMKVFKVDIDRLFVVYGKLCVVGVIISNEEE